MVQVWARSFTQCFMCWYWREVCGPCRECGRMSKKIGMPEWPFSIVTTSIIASRNPKEFLTRLLLPWFLSTVLLTFDLTWNNKNWLFTWLKLKKLTWTQLRIYFHAISELISEQSKVTQLTLRLPSLPKLGTKDQNYSHPTGAVSSFMHNGKQAKGHNSCRKIIIIKPLYSGLTNRVFIP